MTGFTKITKFGFLYNDAAIFFLLRIGSNGFDVWIYRFPHPDLVRYGCMVYGADGLQHICHTGKKQSRPPVWFGSVSLKDIVLGRYIFMFLNYLVAFFAIIAVNFGFAFIETPKFGHLI